MPVNGTKFDFSRFQHLDTAPDLERDGVETPIPTTVPMPDDPSKEGNIVLVVRRAGGRNYGFDAHREAVQERWRKTHGRGTLKGDDLRSFNRDVFVACIAGWNDDVVGYPFSSEGARALIELEEVYSTVVDRAAGLDGYRKDRAADAVDAAGNV